MAKSGRGVRLGVLLALLPLQGAVVGAVFALFASTVRNLDASIVLLSMLLVAVAGVVANAVAMIVPALLLGRTRSGVWPASAWAIVAAGLAVLAWTTVVRVTPAAPVAVAFVALCVVNAGLGTALVVAASRRRSSSPEGAASPREAATPRR